MLNSILTAIVHVDTAAVGHVPVTTRTETGRESWNGRVKALRL